MNYQTEVVHAKSKSAYLPKTMINLSNYILKYHKQGNSQLITAKRSNFKSQKVINLL